MMIPPGLWIRSSAWLNDAIEMFFDGGNEDAASYDANDIQWRWVRDETPENNPIGDGPGTCAWVDDRRWLYI